MFELLGRLWTAVTGGRAKSEKAEIQAKEKAKAKGQATHNADVASGKGSASIRRQYAGRLPVCAGCMNIGSCAGFFPSCGCYGNNHDTVKVSAGDWQSKSHIAKGSGIASPEFAAWCAFMGYALAEKHWAEYEDVWNYYETALQEYGSEYEAFDELAELNKFDEFAIDDDDEYAFGEYDGSGYDDERDDEYNGYDDYDDYDDYDRNAVAYDDYDHAGNCGGHDDYDGGHYGDDDY